MGRKKGRGGRRRRRKRQERQEERKGSDRKVGQKKTNNQIRNINKQKRESEGLY